MLEMMRHVVNKRGRNNWEVMTDTWHETVGEAMAQAEFEYTGTQQTWVKHTCGETF